MPSHKLGRTTEDIRRELSALLRELKDPRTQNMLLSIVRVEVTNDLSYCTVYVSAMEGLDRAKTAVQGLKSASGFLRRELGRRLQLRHVPELIFKATDSIPPGAHLRRRSSSQRTDKRKKRKPERAERTGRSMRQRGAARWQGCGRQHNF